MTEIWKSLKGIVECGDNYEISNLGNVRNATTKKLLSFWYDKDGYSRVTIQLMGKRKNYGVHRLVALAFLPNIDNKPTVNHNDANKKNNNVSNLEWATHQEQVDHLDDNNLRSMPKGEDWYNSKLTEEKVREIFSLYKSGKLSQQKIADLYGVSKGAIQGIVYRTSWKHLDLE
jgi:HNH endonuclease/NUMOD4 motif